MKPIICGIVNATPDSFFDGGKYSNPTEHAKRLIEEGADWIDVGGESTRPGAQLISTQEEMDRVLPVIEAISQDILVSIDTTKGAVAVEAHRLGATILNDVRGFQDLDMQEASKLFDKAILMHSKGRPQNMQQLTGYENVVEEVLEWLNKQSSCCHVKEIWLDPGIGFAKDLSQNIELLKNLERFTNLERPILLGTSRKSFIGGLLNQPNPKDRLFGSLATVADGWYKGVQAFRVHDVKATRDLLTVLQHIQ
jgi:dihydropteroate synthase